MNNVKEKDKKLAQIKKRVVNCQKCSLYQTRNYPVVGQGNHNAQFLFIGEAPGKNEDQTGRPFCGRSGQILDELLASINLNREDIYICNILKCRPPGNRDPQTMEIKQCSPYLTEQIKIIGPQVICSLGRFAMDFLITNFASASDRRSISENHGRVLELEINSQKIVFIPLYHPAVAVYNSNMKESLKNDFQVLKNYLNK